MLFLLGWKWDICEKTSRVHEPLCFLTWVLVRQGVFILWKFIKLDLEFSHFSLVIYTKVCKLLSCVQLFATPCTIACQAPLSVESNRQGYWSGLPCSSPGHLPDPGIEPVSLKSPALAGRLFTTSNTWEAFPLYNLFELFSLNLLLCIAFEWLILALHYRCITTHSTFYWCQCFSSYS